jgi:acyl carrier protein
MDRTTVDNIVCEALRNQLEADGEVRDGVGMEAVLLGSDALIDSLGLVNIIIEIEQVLLDEHDISVTLVDEKAMSQRNSPFRTVDTLSAYTTELVQSAGAAR